MADDQSIIWTGLAIDITEQKNLQNKIQILNKQLNEQAETDYLTGLINRRRFYSDIKKQFNRFERYDEIFCLAIIDLDNFKSINNHYGHEIGDELLKHFSKILKSKIRNTDVCSRIGGEEFALFFPHTTLEEGILICERIISEIKFIENSKNNNSKIVYTCSIGLTEVTDGDIFSNVFNRADQKLYNAKNNGKNQLKY
ncbi:MAG: GGDEF domain-containing protein [Saprospiraceae bacterium]